MKPAKPPHWRRQFRVPEHENTSSMLSWAEDGAVLESLFPGCSVMWDVFPAWDRYYLRVCRGSLADFGMERTDESPVLRAWRTNELGATCTPTEVVLWHAKDERWIVDPVWNARRHGDGVFPGIAEAGS